MEIIQNFNYMTLHNKDRNFLGFSPSYEFEKLIGDASKKEFYKIHHLGVENKSSLLIKITKEAGNFDETFDSKDEYSQYDYFKHTFNLLLNNVGKVPKILSHDDINGVILMEHVGNLRCKELILNRISKNEDIVELYQKMIDWLIRLHDLSDKLLNDDMAKKRVFGRKSMKDEIQNFKHFMRMNIDDERQFDSVIETIFDYILEDGNKMTICHRDFQIRNIMYHDNDICVIDTQDMSLGPMYYDLACLLYDSNVILSNEMREFLAKYYFTNLKNIQNTDFQHFMTKVKLLGMIRIMKSYGVHTKYFVKNGQKESYMAIKNNKKLLNDIIETLVSNTQYAENTDFDKKNESLLLSISTLRDIIYSHRVVPVILAAGKGSRMKSELPKTICEIDGRPMLFYILDEALKLNPYKILIVVGYKKDEIIAKLKEYPLDIEVEFIEQTDTLGTGHAVLQTKSSLENINCNTLVLYGDKPCIKYETLHKLIVEHNSQNYDTTILTYKGEPSFKRCGRIIRDGNNKILQMYEDENANYVSDEFNGGIQIFNNQTLFKLLPRLTNNNKQNEYYLTDMVKLINDSNGKIGNVMISSERRSELMNVNTPDDLHKATLFFKE